MIKLSDILKEVKETFENFANILVVKVLKK
jgi:hypothetical protein